MIEAPAIWLPRRELWVPELETNCTSRMRGRYKFAVIRSDGTVRVSTPWMDNIVTNAGLDDIGNRNGPLTYCHVGTGSTTPAVTDTGLTTWLASTNTVFAGPTYAASGISPYMGTTTVTYQFAAGVATGNISEVGVGPNASNTNMFSHALVVDGGGSPTTITVLVTEALQVTYQLQAFPPLVDVSSGNLTLTGATGSPFATVVRAAYAGNSQYWAPQPYGGMYYGSGYSLNGTYATQTLGAITAAPAGTAYSVPSPVNQAYSNGNYYMDSTLNFSLTDANTGSGVGSAFLCFGPSGSMGAFQVSFTGTGSVTIPKDGSHIMTWYVRHTWSRYP